MLIVRDCSLPVTVVEGKCSRKLWLPIPFIASACGSIWQQLSLPSSITAAGEFITFLAGSAFNFLLSASIWAQTSDGSHSGYPSNWKRLPAIAETAQRGVEGSALAHFAFSAS
jgi:hypothetical protein